MNVRDFYLEKEIEKKPNPGVKTKRWQSAMLIMIGALAIIISVSFYNSEIKVSDWQTLVFIAVWCCAGVCGFVGAFNLLDNLEKPLTISHLPTRIFPIQNIAIVDTYHKFNVKNMKGEDVLIDANIPHRIDVVEQTVGVEISGTLENTKYTLVIPSRLLVASAEIKL